MSLPIYSNEYDEGDQVRMSLPIYSIEYDDEDDQVRMH